MQSSQSKKERETIINLLLVDIVNALGGTVYSNDRNSLLQSWLDALGG